MGYTINVLVNGLPEDREFVYAFQASYRAANSSLVGEHLKLVPVLRANEEMNETPDGRISITSVKPGR